MPACSQASSVPVRPHAGHHLVGDEQHVVPPHIACISASTAGEYIRMPPAPRISGSTMKAAGACAAMRIQRVQRRLLAPRFGKRDRADIEQQRRIGLVEHAARADRHRADRVAVIAMLHHQDAVARLAAIGPEAERHLQRDLDAGRSAVREEDMRKRVGHHRDQCARQRLGRLVGPAGEDDLVELGRLLRDRRHDPRMAVAMRRHPPGRDRIDDAPAVGGDERGALGMADQRDRLAQPMLGERMPDRRRHPAKSSMLKCAAKARPGCRGRADRAAAAGRAAGRRRSRAIVASLSSFASPTKAMPRIGDAARAQRLDRQAGCG